MKQSQKQIVNVIINPEKKKRRRRTKPKEDNINTNTNTNTNTNYPSAVYNPNIISRNRQPSYGIASINPVIENPILNNIADAIKNPAPKVEEYKKIIQDDLEKNILNKVDDNIENIVNETLSNKGGLYLKNYFQQNPSLLSGASTYQQSVFNGNLEDIQEDIEEKPISKPILKPSPLKFKKRRGRPSKQPKSQLEDVLEKIDEVKKRMDKLSNQNKLEKEGRLLNKLLELKANLLENNNPD
jgi:hypothetical protein